MDERDFGKETMASLVPRHHSHEPDEDDVSRFEVTKLRAQRNAQQNSEHSEEEIFRQEFLLPDQLTSSQCELFLL